MIETDLLQVKPDTNIWKPTIKQEQFLALPYSVLEAFYAGAVYAGKSDVLLLYPIIHRFHEHPQFKGLFLRRTFPELKNEIIPRSQKFYRALGGKYNKNDKVWEFPSGALLFFGHLETEEDVHNYDSMQINYCAFDELTSFTEWQYLYLTLQRVRTIKNSQLPAIVRSASNPGNIGHTWVKKRFIDPFPQGMKLIQNSAGISRIFIPATIDDNPHADPNYRKSLESLPEAEKQAKLYGKWDAYEGQVFTEFRDRHYPDEPENAIHVIDPFEIPAWWPKIVVIDWGFRAMNYVTYTAIAPNGRGYVYREQYWYGQKISEWAPYVKEYINKEGPRLVKVCKSAGQERGQDHTIQQDIEDALGMPVELSANTPGTRITGKQLLHEYLRWKKAYTPQTKTATYDENFAQWLFRNRGPLEYKSYMNSFLPAEEENNLPKLQIFKGCDQLVNAIKACVYEKSGTDGKKPEDVRQFDGDDPYDNIRYVVDTIDRFVSDAESEFVKIQKQNELIQRLQTTHNMTAYYISMRKQESESRVKMLRRYH